MRLGIFGGSFDPVHLGHLLMAEACREQAALDRVLFVPTHTQPHKLHHQPAPNAARVEMLQLAVQGNPAFAVETLELDRGGLSYTIETLTALKQRDPTSELFFLMGADSLADFPNWREPQRICELATLLVVQRAGQSPPDYSALAPFLSAEQITAWQAQLIDLPPIALSSTDLRQRVARGRSIRYRTPRAVEMLIADRKLYTVTRASSP
jgi:nicotinate-nucleotide adenylyltransferase